jgi:nitrite reductase/ring-hydroxylating ferredoxin subunit
LRNGRSMPQTMVRPFRILNRIMPSRVELCKVDDVGVGEVRRIAAAGLTLAVYNLDGAFYATDDACTHGPGSLSEGFIEGDMIECNFHQGGFNIRTGEVVKPPCMVPVKTYRTIVEEGRVYIEL